MVLILYLNVNPSLLIKPSISLLNGAANKSLAVLTYSSGVISPYSDKCFSICLSYFFWVEKLAFSHFLSIILSLLLALSIGILSISLCEVLLSCLFFSKWLVNWYSNSLTFLAASFTFLASTEPASILFHFLICLSNALCFCSASYTFIAFFPSGTTVI